MTRARLRPFVVKEVRALLPVWLASACAGRPAAVRSAVPRRRRPRLLVYGVGSVALGALSIGHEYTHRTLTLLLSQPGAADGSSCVKLRCWPRCC